MYEAFLLVCLSAGGCFMAESSQGMLVTEELCYQRIAEMHMDITDHYAGQGIAVVWYVPNCNKAQSI